MQKFKLAGQGFGKVLPPEHLRKRIKEYFHPIPIWYQPFEESQINGSKFDLHAITQRPPHMYHSWGSQNAWLRQITSHNFLYISQELAKEKDIKNDDWVWLESSHKKIRVPCRLMRGVNKSTVWTWNAIGKRKGAWNLSPNAPESNKGFLLNHLISELLPKQKDGYRYSNSDPITGQASWYDLKVKITKCLPNEILEKKIEPQFPIIKNLSRKNINLLKYGAQFKKTYNSTKKEEHYEFIGNIESYKETE
jgi:anaerobic selenocysteine-containing dehydrogenase